MARKRFTPKQIVVILREIEVLLSQGQDLGLACRGQGISTWSY
jgi:hypothetical protein